MGLTEGEYMTANDRSRKTIQAVENTLTILDTLYQRDGAGVTAISEEVDLSKGAISHHLATLEAYGLVTGINGEYHPTIQFLSYGAKARERFQVYQNARLRVDELADRTGEIVKLAVERDTKSFCLYQSIGEDVTEPWSHTGIEEPLYRTASGKALLAAFPDERLDSYFDEVEFVQRTADTVTDAQRLREEIEAIRETNIAYDDEEHIKGVRCVGTSITDESGTLLGAISVSGRTERVSDNRFREEIPRELQNIAGVVGISSTYSVWK